MKTVLNGAHDETFGYFHEDSKYLDLFAKLKRNQSVHPLQVFNQVSRHD